MCGIAGVLSIDPLKRDFVNAMKDSLAHRGPDADGVYFNGDETVALAHTRLSIIDLRAEANQPFSSGNGRYVGVFNGEIYNFLRLKKILREEYGLIFRTNSDTEVIVEGFALLGTQIIEKLQGMFAVCIYDLHEETLHLFRDRIGKKPLFYFLSESIFAFASEIKSLLCYPTVRNEAKIDGRSITSFLHLGYIPEPFTIYSSIKKFPAGHRSVIKRDLKLVIEPYWKVIDALQGSTITSVEIAKKELKHLLEQAVEDRLISDVPLGAFLSGGVDSSLVTAVASKLVAAPLKTFNIGFRESKFNESHYASAVSKILNTNHTEYFLAEKEGMDILETYVTHFDEPFADASAIPTMLVSKLARKDVKVVLTGDGGDESFLGYGTYTWADRLANPLWQRLSAPLGRLLNVSGQSRLQRIGELLEPVKYGNVRSHIFSQEHYLFSQREIVDNLLIDKNNFHLFFYEDLLESKRLTPAEQQALFDFQYYLKDDLLVKVDRASMYYGLECRCPLLDHSLVEFAGSLHPSLKVKGYERKWILKELLREYLPSELIFRTKQGFSVPMADWLRGDLRYLIEKYLSQEAIEKAGLFKPSAIRSLIQDFFNGKNHLYNRLWTLIVLHKWMDENL